MNDSALQFDRQLDAFRARISRLLLERMLCRGLALAGLLALPLVLVTLLTSWYITPEGLLLLAVLGALGGVVFARLRPISRLAAALTVERQLRLQVEIGGQDDRAPREALTVERRQGLQERASTAVALTADNGSDPEFCALVTGDAAAHLASCDPRTLFPRHFTREHKAALPIWALVLLLLLAPNLPWLYSPEAREERAAMSQAGQTLQQQAQQLAKHPEFMRSPESRRLLRAMDKLAAEMAKNRISRKEALKRLNALKAQLAQLEKQQAKQDAGAAGEMQHAAQDVQQALEGRSPAEKEEAARTRDKIASGKKLEQLSAEERAVLQREQSMQRLAQQLAANDQSGAIESLQQLGQMLSSMPLSARDQAQLAKALQRLANTLKTMNSADAKALARDLMQAAKELQKQTAAGQQRAGRILAAMPSLQAMMQGQVMGQAGENLDDAKQQMLGNGELGAMPGTQPGQQQGSAPGSGQHGSPGPGNQGGNQPGPGIGGGSGGGGRAGTHGGSHPRSGGSPSPEQVPTSNAQNSIEVPGEKNGHAGEAPVSNVPYANVYPEYRKAAENAVDHEQVPLAERQRVKAYFDALNPTKK